MAVEDGMVSRVEVLLDYGAGKHTNYACIPWVSTKMWWYEEWHSLNFKPVYEGQKCHSLKNVF